MGWSISPSSSIARIDADSGQATFGHHDNDKTYIIAYTSEDTGTITHQFTVYGCTPPTPATTCEDVVVQGLTTNCDAKEEVRIGSYNGFSSVDNVSSSENWITSLTAEGGYVYGNVEKNEDNDSREATIYITGITSDGACTKRFTFTQRECGGGGECTCESANFSITGKTLDGSGNINVVVATYTAECDDNAEVRFVEGDNFVQNPFINNGEVMGGRINPYEGIRTGTYAIYISGVKCAEFTVTQNGSGVCNCAAIMVDSETTFDKNGGITKVGSLSSGCELIVYGSSDWCSLYQEGTDVKVSASTNSSANSRHAGFGYKVGNGMSNCGDIAVHQNGSGTTYNIVLRPTYDMGVSNVTFKIVYDKSGGPHTPFITNGTINVQYWNCNNTRENPRVPDGHVITLCETGSGQAGQVNKQDPGITLYTVECYLTIGGVTEKMVSGDSKDIVVGDITYHVTCQ
jgi:hypothetical protein